MIVEAQPRWVQTRQRDWTCSRVSEIIRRAFMKDWGGYKARERAWLLFISPSEWSDFIPDSQSIMYRITAEKYNSNPSPIRKVIRYITVRESGPKHSALKVIWKVIRHVPLACNRLNSYTNVRRMAPLTGEQVQSRCLVLTHHGCASSIINLAANVWCFLDQAKERSAAVQCKCELKRDILVSDWVEVIRYEKQSAIV